MAKTPPQIVPPGPHPASLGSFYMTAERPPSLSAAPEIDRRRVLQLIDEQRNLLAERTTRSGEYYERARRVMPNGVPSSFQENDPWPVYIERGTGANVWDVDG